MEYQVGRVRERIDKLAGSARAPEGGVTRLSYTPAYREAMVLVRGFMEEAGMKVRIDPLGNIFGRFDGNDRSLPVVLTGSHLDSVPNGGKLSASTDGKTLAGGRIAQSKSLPCSRKRGRNSESSCLPAGS